MSAVAGTKTGTESSGPVKSAANPDAPTRRDPRRAKHKPKPLPPYHVVLLDDADHTHEYVMEMMRVLFGYPSERGYLIAQEVDTRKKAIVLTTHKELAELKRDQIHAYGTDLRVATCAGSMSACIVAAE
jgi:ATP-dependent Clp protease adaptor protein ClpS